MWKSLIRNEQGQDAIEYTLLMASIVLACAATVMAVGDQVNSLWSIVNSRLAAANTSAQ